MTKILIVSLLFILPSSAKSYVGNPVTEKIKSDISEVYITISYDSNYSASDYIAETNSGLEDTDKYVTERGLDKGLIFIPCPGERFKNYKIDSDTIYQIIKARYEMDVYNRTDFIFTSSKIFIVHTSASNAGIFTGSDIYSIPRFKNKEKYKSYLDFQDEKCSGNKKLLLEVLDFCIRHDISI